MKSLVKRIYSSAPLWAWVVMVICVISLIVGLVISSNRTPPTSPAAPVAPTPSAIGPTTPPATVAFMNSARTDRVQPKMILLLGDSTGASPKGWSAALGRAISGALDRTVATAYWNPASAKYGVPVDLGQGRNGPIRYWNGSAEGKSANYAVDNLRGLTTTQTGEAINPDLILLNFGMSEDRTQPLASRIQPLITALRKKYPASQIAAIKQNPSRNSDNSGQVSGYAAAMEAEGIQVIDVYSAFPTVATQRASLMSDDINPNDEGQELWTRTVLASFGLSSIS